MTTAILAERIYKQKLDLKEFLKWYALLAIKEMKKTTKTWDSVDPDFTYKIVDRGTGVRVGPKDNEDGLIWLFLEGGTSERFAQMTSDFVSKTSPGFVGSRGGSGGFSHFVVDPLPGIEARDWNLLISKKLEPIAAKQMVKLLKRLY